MMVSTSTLSRMLPSASHATHVIGRRQQTIKTLAGTALAGETLTKATALILNRQSKRYRHHNVYVRNGVYVCNRLCGSALLCVFSIFLPLTVLAILQQTDKKKTSSSETSFETVALVGPRNGL